jgi:aspartate carbamoyltransferase
MDTLGFTSRLQRPVMMKVPELERNGRLKHVLFAAQFDRDLLDHLGRIATMVREISKTKSGADFLISLLSHKRAMLYFTQASTRTFLSFMAASQLLGLTCNEIRDPSLSSEFKGESPFDSVRMFSSYFDVIIMRSKIPDFAESCAYLMNDLEAFHQRSVPIINAGAGADEHPTQALLDIYTIQRSFAFESPNDSSRYSRFEQLRAKYPGLGKGLDHKTYGFCGDIGRGRTVRSLATLLTRFDNITMYFIAPDHPKLKLAPDTHRMLADAGVKVRFSDDLSQVIGELDLLYMTRIQHEHDSPEDRAFFDALDTSKYQLSPELVARMKDYAPILHPFPRNEEIPFSIDSDPRAMYFRQARNGMWSRASLLAYLFDVDTKIMTYHEKSFSTFHDYNTSRL